MGCSTSRDAEESNRRRGWHRPSNTSFTLAGSSTKEKPGTNPDPAGTTSPTKSGGSNPGDDGFIELDAILPEATAAEEGAQETDSLSGSTSSREGGGGTSPTNKKRRSKNRRNISPRAQESLDNEKKKQLQKLQDEHKHKQLEEEERMMKRANPSTSDLVVPPPPHKDHTAVFFSEGPKKRTPGRDAVAVVAAVTGIRANCGIEDAGNDGSDVAFDLTNIPHTEETITTTPTAPTAVERPSFAIEEKAPDNTTPLPDSSNPPPLKSNPLAPPSTKDLEESTDPRGQPPANGACINSRQSKNSC